MDDTISEPLKIGHDRLSPQLLYTKAVYILEGEPILDLFRFSKLYNLGPLRLFPTLDPF